MLTLSLAEEVRSGFPKKFYADIFRTTMAVTQFRAEDGFRLSRKKVTLNAVAVSEEKIRELNKTYRGLDRATDILSFGEESLQAQGPEVFLGELFFSPEYIRTQARQDGGTYRQAMIFIFSHGILHVLGYDHGKKMFGYQDVVTEKLSQRSRITKKPSLRKTKK